MGPSETEMESFSVLSLASVFFISFVLCCSRSVSCLTELPEFTEPIKNITVTTGTNVELSCYVKYLGSYRVMWLKREAFKESLLAINSLKISKSPRIKITFMQTSDEISQSNIYVYGVEMEDAGPYECAVNTNPMMSRIGVVEVTATVENVFPFTPVNMSSVELSNGTASDNLTTVLPDVTENNDGDILNVTRPCGDRSQFWEEATKSIKDLVENFVKSVVEFTCSLLA